MTRSAPEPAPSALKKAARAARNRLAAVYPSPAATVERPLLDLEAALDRGLVAARLAHDDLELELVGEAGEVFGKLELGHLRWQLDAEPRAFPLDDELVSDDLDLARSADLGMRPRDRVPADDHGLAD